VNTSTLRRAGRLARRSAAAATVAALVMASPASASVAFDPATGTGTIDKNVIQQAFGWNNTTFQQNASGISFRYEQTVIAYVDCTKEVQKQTMAKSWVFEQAISDDLVLDAKTAKGGRQQVVGFSLNGFAGAQRVAGDAPKCPGGWEQDGEVYFTAPATADGDDVISTASAALPGGVLLVVNDQTVVTLFEGQS
jgi:hypothetical protein